ncbi:MAG: hypothetical protein V1809_03295 [Planctomycetota bacterium]
MLAIVLVLFSSFTLAIFVAIQTPRRWGALTGMSLATVAFLFPIFVAMAYRRTQVKEAKARAKFMSLVNAHIGTVESACPYCKTNLEKRPVRKSKCKSCGQYIYVRTRPSDKKKVLVTEDQKKKIDELWAAAGNPSPQENDAKWASLNMESLEHVKNGNWGLYRNVRLGQAKILQQEKKWNAALGYFLWTCYLDVNGPNNLGGLSSEMSKQKRFDPADGTFAPGVINGIAFIMEEQAIEMERVETVFLEVATREFKGLELPISPEEAWKQIGQELVRRDYCPRSSEA